MEGNMVRLIRRCQLAKSTKEDARALEGKVRILMMKCAQNNLWEFCLDGKTRVTQPSTGVQVLCRWIPMSNMAAWVCFAGYMIPHCSGGCLDFQLRSLGFYLISQNCEEGTG